MEKTPFSFYRIRFSDCDLFGHLNNARYIDYFLNAREDHLKDNYDVELKNFYSQDLAWVVASHEILYRRPALYSEKVFISSTLVKIADDIVQVEMLMMDEKQTHLKAILWTTFIPVNAKTGKKESHPSSFMEFAAAVENKGIDIGSGIRAREASMRKNSVK